MRITTPSNTHLSVSLSLQLPQYNYGAFVKMVGHFLVIKGIEGQVRNLGPAMDHEGLRELHDKWLDIAGQDVLKAALCGWKPYENVFEVRVCVCVWVGGWVGVGVCSCVTFGQLRVFGRLQLAEEV